MMSPLAVFLSIVSQFEQSHNFIARGSMLAAPALEYKGRAFAFCKHGNIILKLEHGAGVHALGIRGSARYNPFNIAQTNSWIQVPYYYHQDWKELVEMAYYKMQEEIG
jgi:hypothetical protein